MNQAVKAGRESLVAQGGDMIGKRTVKGEIAETAAWKAQKGKENIQKAE